MTASAVARQPVAETGIRQSVPSRIDFPVRHRRARGRGWVRPLVASFPPFFGRASGPAANADA